jgi:hypothetical protein
VYSVVAAEAGIVDGESDLAADERDGGQKLPTSFIIIIVIDIDKFIKMWYDRGMAVQATTTWFRDVRQVGSQPVWLPRRLDQFSPPGDISGGQDVKGKIV